jgi:hypothetical protein
VNQQTAITTLPPSERAAIVLESSKAETQLRELVTKSTAITNVIDPAGREEAHRAGMTLKNARIAIEKTGKAAREDAQAFSKAVISEEKRLIDIITPEEERVFGLRDAFDLKVKREREEAERRERERVAAIRTKIEAIRQIPATMAGEPSSEIYAEMEALKGFHPDESFGEFASEARIAVHGAFAALAALYDRVSAQEAETARIAAERAELERLRAEAETRERQARELREAEEARARAIREGEERRLAEERERFEDERRAFLMEQANARRQDEKMAAREAAEQCLPPEMRGTEWSPGELEQLAARGTKPLEFNRIKSDLDRRHMIENDEPDAFHAMRDSAAVIDQILEVEPVNETESPLRGLLDRILALSELFQRDVVENPDAAPLRADAEKIMEQLGCLYQKAGELAAGEAA